MSYKIDDILSIIYSLSFSQGFYGRLFRDLMDIKNTDDETWEEVVAELEGQNFHSDLDVVLYFEG